MVSEIIELSRMRIKRLDAYQSLQARRSSVTQRLTRSGPARVPAVILNIGVPEDCMGFHRPDWASEPSRIATLEVRASLGRC
jgi:hypothetical protein